MTNPLPNLRRYLDELGDSGSSIAPAPHAAKSLPVFISRIYEPYRGRIFGRDYVLLVCTAKDHPAPGQVEKHVEIAREALGPNVAIVFSSLPSFDRKRLIQRRIPFIVPGRQTYLPLVMIDLREKSLSRLDPGGQRPEALSAPAQVLLLYHLQKNGEAEDWPLNRWADILGYSRMTLTRAYRELLSADLCRPSGRGRQVLVQFVAARQAMWKKASPYLRSPVAGRHWMRVVTPRNDLPLYQAGMSALAQWTMMAAGREEEFAMAPQGYRAALEDDKLISVPYAEGDAVAVERWRYDPRVLSPDGHTVDRLSLYLSLQHDQDERVQAALKEMLETLPW